MCVFLLPIAIIRFLSIPILPLSVPLFLLLSSTYPGIYRSFFLVCRSLSLFLCLYFHMCSHVCICVTVCDFSTSICSSFSPSLSLSLSLSLSRPTFVCLLFTFITLQFDLDVLSDVVNVCCGQSYKDSAIVHYDSTVIIYYSVRTYSVSVSTNDGGVTLYNSKCIIYDRTAFIRLSTRLSLSICSFFCLQVFSSFL